MNRCSLKRSAVTDKNTQADKQQDEGPCSGSTVLVEEVVVHFDLGAGSEVVWKQHDGHRHLAQVINLRMISG